MNKDVCQFYVVLGDSSFVAPNDLNVYINATNIIDYKMIQDEIFRVYKEKAKQGVSVGSEIIFLVGGISDSEKANDIITKLRLNGKIQVIRKIEPEVKKEDTEDKEKIKKTVPEEMPKLEVKEEKQDVGMNVLTEKKEETKEELFGKLDSKYNELEENKQPDNVYRRDFDSNNYSGYIGKPIKEKEKFGKLPLIIFIISLLLFIGSVVLLFVL